MISVINTNPSCITGTLLDYYFDILENNPLESFGVVHKLSERRKDLFTDHYERLGNIMKKFPQFGASFAVYAGRMVSNEKDAEYFLRVMWDIFTDTTETSHKCSILYGMKEIAATFKEQASVYKEDIFNAKTSGIQEYVDYFMNTLEERNLRNLSEKIQDQQNEINDLDVRVTNNEGRIESIDQDLQLTKKDVEIIKMDVEYTKKKVEEIDYTVKGLDERVEKLGHMTLSHAPAWSCHVADLMNMESDKDWRLLALRLNYTVEDVRNWATQPDPCLSLLDEWFATHKTKEATFAILKTLKDIDRLDAAEIVETALTSVKDVVQDDNDTEIDKPEIFISYQWGHQKEVKLLRKHLEQAGFKAWMDIGQMGGGDKLFAKIDDGVRSAKIILSCVSENYALSANCCREVNLSTNLGKPIIPLLMEQMQWPPAGPMSPVLSEYLYIKFFKPGSIKTKENVFWLPEKFQELLMQISYQVSPDNRLIKDDSPYNNWQNPPEEEIIITKKETKESNKSSTNTVVEENQKSPDVFISYQWDKQAEIKNLYKKLTDYGYECWLDIMQMGGGDSLYDKIDKGIRGAKVIVSCVTLKYSLSKNCQREVSLSDSLSKPIVPIVLEDISWPPKGPMSMAFTGLERIPFFEKNGFNIWKGSEYDSLLQKINSYAPVKDSKKIASDSEDAIDSDRDTEKHDSEIARLNEANTRERERLRKEQEQKRQEEKDKLKGEKEKKKKEREEQIRRQKEEQEREENAKKKREKEEREKQKRQKELKKRREEEEQAQVIEQQQLEQQQEQQYRQEQQQQQQQRQQQEQQQQKYSTQKNETAARPIQHQPVKEEKKSSFCILL